MKTRTKAVQTLVAALLLALLLCPAAHAQEEAVDVSLPALLAIPVTAGEDFESYYASCMADAYCNGHFDIYIERYLGTQTDVCVPDRLETVTRTRTSDEGVETASVTVISFSAFAETDVRRVVLPEDTCCIAEGAFENCTQLQAIVIPCKYVEIMENAFAGCPSDMIIYGVPGTQAEEAAQRYGVRFVDIENPDEVISLPALTITDQVDDKLSLAIDKTEIAKGETVTVEIVAPKDYGWWATDHRGLLEMEYADNCFPTRFRLYANGQVASDVQVELFYGYPIGDIWRYQLTLEEPSIITAEICRNGDQWYACPGQLEVTVDGAAPAAD